MKSYSIKTPKENGIIKALIKGLFTLKNILFGIGKPKTLDIGTFRGLLREINLEEVKEFYRICSSC